jgi:hypothetical protein
MKKVKDVQNYCIHRESVSRVESCVQKGVEFMRVTNQTRLASEKIAVVEEGEGGVVTLPLKVLIE